MPTYVRTPYTERWNFPPASGSKLAQCQDFLYFVMTFLIGARNDVTQGVGAPGADPGEGAWRVYASSNSLAVAGIGGNIASGADLVWDVDGNAHSWVELEAPVDYPTTGKRLHLIVDLNRADTALADFVLTSFTPGDVPVFAGTTTRRPLYLNSREIRYNVLNGYDNANTGGGTPVSTAGSGSGHRFMDSAASALLRVHVTRSASGDVAILANWLGSAKYDGGGNPGGFRFDFDFLVNAFSPNNSPGATGQTDVWPIYAHSFFNWSGGRGNLTGESAPTRSHASNVRLNSRLFWLDGTVVNNNAGQGVLPYYGVDGLGDPLSSMNNGGDSANARFPEVPFQVGHDAVQFSYRGWGVDLWLAPYGNAISCGDTVPVGGPPEACAAGQFWLKCNTAPEMN